MFQKKAEEMQIRDAEPVKGLNFMKSQGPGLTIDTERETGQIQRTTAQVLSSPRLLGTPRKLGSPVAVQRGEYALRNTGVLSTTTTNIAMPVTFESEE